MSTFGAIQELKYPCLRKTHESSLQSQEKLKLLLKMRLALKKNNAWWALVYWQRGWDLPKCIKKATAEVEDVYSWPIAETILPRICLLLAYGLCNAPDTSVHFCNEVISLIFIRRSNMKGYVQVRCCLQFPGASVALQAAGCRVHWEQQRNKKSSQKLRNFRGETLGFHCQLLLFRPD